MPGFQPHAGKIAPNPMHKSYGHVSFSLGLFQNENDFTVVYDNTENTCIENSKNTKKRKKVTFLSILKKMEVRTTTSQDCWEG